MKPLDGSEFNLCDEHKGAYMIEARYTVCTSCGEPVDYLCIWHNGHKQVAQPVDCWGNAEEVCPHCGEGGRWWKEESGEA